MPFSPRAFPRKTVLGRFPEISFCLPKDSELFAGRFESALGEEFPNRPAVSPLGSILWTRMSDAPRAGAVRAMTERFCTDMGGRAMLPRV